jgi:UPF0755 protein
MIRATDLPARRRLIAGFTLLALLACAACSSDSVSSAYLHANSAALHQGASDTMQPTQFVIEPGASARRVASQLQDAGLIKDARLFEAYLRASGLAGKLQAGAYMLSPHMTPVQIAEALLHARPASVVLTVPEGWRLEQIADGLQASGVMDGAAYRRIAESGDLSGLDAGAPERYRFLQERPTGATLEGYLFPDTYELLADAATPEALLRRQLDAFVERVLPQYRQATTAGAGRSLTLHEVITLASIVERETAAEDERPMVAGVYLNRLAQGMRLEADPTVQYAMGFQPQTGQWWKSPVYLEEYSKVISPYNTYLNAGLPPGPIANPGLKSIEAVLNPAQHDYLFFMAAGDGSGRHLFARSFAEHLENVKRYQGK